MQERGSCAVWYEDPAVQLDAGVVGSTWRNTGSELAISHTVHAISLSCAVGKLARVCRHVYLPHRCARTRLDRAGHWRDTVVHAGPLVLPTFQTDGCIKVVLKTGAPEERRALPPASPAEATA